MGAKLIQNKERKKMNKKIISLLMAAGIMMSAVPAMATTEGIIQGDILLTSAGDAETAKENTYIGVVKEIAENAVSIEIDGMEVSFVLAEGVTAEGIAEGDTVAVTSTSALKTKDIKEATSIVKSEKATKDEAFRSYNNYIAVVDAVEENSVTVTIDGDMVVSFITDDKTAVYTIDGEEADAVKAGDKVIVVSASALLTKDMKYATAIIINNEDVTASVYVDKFNMTEDRLISADGELVLNIDDAAQYDGKKLLVFYNFMTMSLPAQTTPTKIVVLEDDCVGISFKVGDSILTINGTKVEVETPYVIGEGVTLVPLRVISEAFGAEVEWNGETKEVTIVDGDNKVVVAIGSKTAVVNGEEKELEEAPELKNDVTMIPLRFISENLGATVDYDDATAAITVVR